MICFCERKLKNEFGVAFCYLYKHRFWSLSRDISIYSTTFLFCRFVQNVIVSCFSDSFFQKTTQQSDGSCNGTSNSHFFLQIINKNSLFSSANTYEKYIVSKENCIARHDHKMCFLPNCRYHIILIGNIKELLQKLDAFCFNYQHMDCLYTFSSTTSVAKLLSRVDKALIICRGQFISTSKTEEWTECPASRKRDFRGKKTKNVC